jgi:diaminopimelate epimerase
MKFVQYSGAGNTFLLTEIDEKSELLPLDPRQISQLCNQAKVDGVIVLARISHTFSDSSHTLHDDLAVQKKCEKSGLEASRCVDAKMRIFNRDGSEAEMCGNGLRCCIRFLKDLGNDQPCYRIETLAGLQQGWVCGDEVCVQLATPTELNLNLPDNLYFLNTGVPHVISFVDAIESINVNDIGRALRFSPLFAPAGANVNFVCQMGENMLAVRTYERGVEAETQACGTGAVASALIASKVLALSSPIQIRVYSGQTLTVSFNPNWSEVTLQGPARREGQLAENCIKSR